MVLSACLYGVLICSPSPAAVVSYSSSFAIGDSFDYDELEGAFASNLFDFQTLALPRFDAALGALQSVQISLTSLFRRELIGSADDGTREFDQVIFPPIIYNYRNDAGLLAGIAGTLHFQLLDPASSSLTFNTQNIGDSCYDRDTGAASYVHCDILANDFLALNGSLPLGGLNVASFVGSSPLGLQVFFNGQAFGNCDADDVGDYCFLFASALWSGNVSVNYTYAVATDGDGGTTTVPEPAPLALLALGLLAFGSARAASQKKQN